MLLPLMLSEFFLSLFEFGEFSYFTNIWIGVQQGGEWIAVYFVQCDHAKWIMFGELCIVDTWLLFSIFRTLAVSGEYS